MKVSRRQLRIILKEVAKKEYLVTEKIVGKQAGGEDLGLAGGNKVEKGEDVQGLTSSVTANEVDASEGVDDCWNKLGDELNGGCNLDEFTVGGRRNYRSAKPGQGSGSGNVPVDRAVLTHLRDKWGIKRIVDLTNDSAEAALANELGIEYTSSDGRYGKPDAETWGTIKSYLDDGDTLIHCTYGADRTGGYVGRYQVENGADMTAVTQAAVSTYGMNALPDNERLHAWIQEPIADVASESYQSIRMTRKNLRRILKDMI